MPQGTTADLYFELGTESSTKKRSLNGTLGYLLT